MPLIIRGPGIEANSWSKRLWATIYTTRSANSQVSRIRCPPTLKAEASICSKERKNPLSVREELVFHFPHYQGDTPHSAIMLGNYKLLHFYETKTNELYDLSKDLKESVNLADKMPEKQSPFAIRYLLGGNRCRRSENKSSIRSIQAAPNSTRRKPGTQRSNRQNDRRQRNQTNTPIILETRSLVLATSAFILISTTFAQNRRGPNTPEGIVRPRLSDTIPVNVYADNWFKLYINGKLVAVDSIDFMPHNVISVDILPNTR